MSSVLGVLVLPYQLFQVLCLSPIVCSRSLVTLAFCVVWSRAPILAVSCPRSVPVCNLSSSSGNFVLLSRVFSSSYINCPRHVLGLSSSSPSYVVCPRPSITLSFCVVCPRPPISQLFYVLVSLVCNLSSFSRNFVPLCCSRAPVSALSCPRLSCNLS